MERPRKIDPRDFKNHTILVESVDNPDQNVVAVVKTPRLLVGEGRGAVTILVNHSSCRENDLLVGRNVIPVDIFENGGEINGLRFTGIQKEAALMYGPDDLDP